MSDLQDLGKPLSHENMGTETVKDLISGGVKAWRESSVHADRKMEVNICSRGGLCRIHSDKMKIQQVIVNLLENACSHSSEEKPIKINVTKSDDGTAIIRITDCGSGMDPDMLPRFFDPFFSTRKDGIGLGTSIVRRIVERHGGNIRVYNNDPPPGLTVEFTLSPKLR